MKKLGAVALVALVFVALSVPAAQTGTEGVAMEGGLKPGETTFQMRCESAPNFDKATWESGVWSGYGWYIWDYAFYNYCKSQVIYNASWMMGSPCVINKIGFYSFYNSPTRHLKIFLGTTTESSFDGTGFLPNPDLVFDGMVDWINGDVTEITFDTPFSYDGTSNLLLVIEDWTGTYTSTHYIVGDNSTSAVDVTAFGYSDYTDPDALTPNGGYYTEFPVTYWNYLESGHDVGVTEIYAPTGEYLPGVSVTPSVEVENFRANDDTFNVTFKISDGAKAEVYTGTQNVVLGPGESQTIDFPAFTTSIGSYTTLAYTELATDEDMGNDTLSGAFEVSLTIYDVQYTTDPGDGTYPSPYVGQEAILRGIVTGVRYNGFWLEEQPGGPWCGVWVFSYTIDPSVGDSLSLTGEVDEYYGMTEIKNVSDYEIFSSGNTVPGPTWIWTGDLSATKDAASAEPYEGVLVRVSGVTVTQTCDSHYEWYVDDGTGECQIDDGMYRYEPEMGEKFASILGCVDYSYGEYGINPRDAGDLEKGLYESFESGVIPDDWTVINADGDSYEWYAYHSASNAHFGEWSARIHYNSSGNDDWLITPQLQVPGAKSPFDNDEFSFWAKSGSSSYPEDFEVWLSTTGTAVGDFTEFLGSETGIPTEYIEYVYGLSAYEGQKVYLAIRCVSEDELYLYVDDIEGPGPVPFVDYDVAVGGLPNADDPDTLDAGVFDAYVAVYNNSVPLTGPTVSFVVYYKIWDDEGNLVGSKSANVWDIEPQEQRVVYFDGGICLPPGTYTAVVTIQTGFDDPVTDNNTSMRVFTVVGGAKMGAEELPQVFALRGCEPNPTRGDAVIRYELPRGVNVSLKVYDSAGRLVESLVDGMRDAGYHRVSWRAPHAGVYFAKLKAGDFKATKRIIAVK